ncbi:MAG: TolC family protein [Pyrinomonadaceae bacterium]
MNRFDQRFLYAILLIAFAFFSIGETRAQDSVPVPSPTPVDAADPMPVDDSQDVSPEKLAGVPSIAPDYESTDKKLPELGRVGVNMLAQRPLGLREAIVKALENNKDIEVSRKDVKIAEFDLSASEGFFSPRITGNTFYERASVPNVSIFINNPATTNTALVADIGYQGFVKNFGTAYSFTFSNRRSTTDSPVSILSPQFNSSFEFKIVQPLFRGRKYDDGRRNIELAKQNLSITDKQFRQKAIDITVNVQRAYWDLAFTLRNLQVQRDGVSDAKEQFEHNKRLVDEGILAPVDIIAAETQVANLEQNVYSALEQVNRAENALKNLIAVNRQDPIWSESLVPTDSVDLQKPKTDLPEALRLALENRIEIEISDVSKLINEYDQKFYKEQLEPEIDLTASYTSNGIAGTANPDAASFFSNTESAQKLNDVINRVNSIDPSRPPISPLPIAPPQTVSPALTGNYLSSVTDIFANRYPTYRFGVTFSFSADGKTQKALLGKSLVQGEKIDIQREQLEQSIQVDVRNALQMLKTADAKLRAASVSRENSEKQYESEKRKLDSGFSDVYKVLERQTALMNARSAELQARTEVNKAIAELQRATGNSLKDNGLETRLRK